VIYQWTNLLPTCNHTCTLGTQTHENKIQINLTKFLVVPFPLSLHIYYYCACPIKICGVYTHRPLYLEGNMHTGWSCI